MSDTEIIISPRRLTTQSKLGEGSFGMVYKGTWKTGKGQNARNVDVAIKILKDEDEDKARDEVKRMYWMDHQNIIKCFGISFPRNADSPWIVMEYMPNGDLLAYMRSYGSRMTSDVMVMFAYGIACGMKYLHHDIRRYHGDLAARNCLIGPNNTVKIGDFGKFVESDDDEDCYYDYGMDVPCPLRWMPPENVPTWWMDPNTRFSRKGDVWAYGVVLFEIWTKGRLPFDGLDNDEVITALQKGETPKDYRNVCAKWYIRDLMDECWEFESHDRPNFKKIVSDLDKNMTK